MEHQRKVRFGQRRSGRRSIARCSLMADAPLILRSAQNYGRALFSPSSTSHLRVQQLDHRLQIVVLLLDLFHAVAVAEDLLGAEQEVVALALRFGGGDARLELRRSLRRSSSCACRASSARRDPQANSAGSGSARCAAWAAPAAEERSATFAGMAAPSLKRSTSSL